MRNLKIELEISLRYTDIETFLGEKEEVVQEAKEEIELEEEQVEN